MSDDNGVAFPGLMDIHAHPAMNAYFWDRDLRRHYFTAKKFNPLASLTDFQMLEEGDVRVDLVGPPRSRGGLLPQPGDPASRPRDQGRPRQC